MLFELLDEKGNSDKALRKMITEKDAEGLLRWTERAEDLSLVAPIQIYASGIFLDKSLKMLTKTTDTMATHAETARTSLEKVKETLQGSEPPKWLH